MIGRLLRKIFSSLHQHKPVRKEGENWKGFGGEKGGGRQGGRGWKQNLKDNGSVIYR